MFLHNVYEIEPSRSRYLILVEWDEVGTPRSMGYTRRQLPEVIQQLEAKGMRPEGTMARAVSKEVNQGRLF